MAYGNDGGLVVVDFVQKSVLLSMATADLYSSADPYTRLPRSPKRPNDSHKTDVEESCRSPSSDQVNSSKNLLIKLRLLSINQRRKKCQAQYPTYRHPPPPLHLLKS